ncbi:hypothetical protein L596_015249 [Steinernema carpocapsae]|uniref:Uncharacterized protein n=1 Tax=Steinernema carpocapsae TaxID=34508 RepID=A0A4U5NEF8_STECR|nr:hypothetical protein L596_015249 [Steinernema carpocapsae]
MPRSPRAMVTRPHSKIPISEAAKSLTESARKPFMNTVRTKGLGLHAKRINEKWGGRRPRIPNFGQRG